MIKDAIPTCPDCGDRDVLMLWCSDLLGICIKCQNCDNEYPLDDLRKLFVSL